MKKFFILFLMATSLASCVEDEGNYTYTEVNEITIEGLEESYYALQGVDVLEIQPKITSTILGENLDNYEYQWHLHLGLIEHKHTVISKEKDLSYKVEAPLGSYTLYFTVLDKTTGIKAVASAPLTIATSITRGFLLFGDDMEEGIAGLDMVVMPIGRDTVVVENVYDNSETRYKNADKILYQGAYSISSDGTDMQSLWMCTEDGSFRMENREKFSVITELNDFGMIELSKDFSYKKPMRVMDVFPHQAYTGRSVSAIYRGYMTEDVCVFGSPGVAEYYATPINRLSENSTELFKFYPLAFMNAANASAFSASYAVIYNMDDNCFMGIYQSKGCALTLKESANDKFPNKQENRTMIWGGNCINTWSYAVMKDLDADNYYLYQFKPGSYSAWSGSTITKQAVYPIDLSKATNFDKASHYMVSGTGSILVYASGSTLYLYNYQYGDLISKDLGGEITYLDQEYCSNNSRTAFIVATYNDTDKGIVRKLNVGTDPNKLEIIENPKEVWNTRLRIKDVEWRISM